MLTLTLGEHGAGVRVFILFLQSGTVPSVLFKLVLTLVNGDLDALNSGSCHVRKSAAQLVLRRREVGVGFTDGVGIEVGFGRYGQTQDIITAR